jgi:hypothetical protein
MVRRHPPEVEIAGSNPAVVNFSILDRSPVFRGRFHCFGVHYRCEQGRVLALEYS